MPRSVNSVAKRARRKKVLKQAKGYFGRRKNVYTVAKNTLEKGLGYVNASTKRFTFQDNKMIAEYSEINDGVTFSIKTIFISDKAFVPDKILGKWEQDQAFIGSIEIEVSACEKMGSVEFFEDGFFEEIAFMDNSEQTECIELPLKTGMWKNIGDSLYKIYGIGADGEIKITFENNKMSPLSNSLVSTVLLVKFSISVLKIPVTFTVASP